MKHPSLNVSDKAKWISRSQILAAVDNEWRSVREILLRIRGHEWQEQEPGEAYRARIQIIVGLRPMRIQGLVERRKLVGQAYEWRTTNALLAHMTSWFRAICDEHKEKCAVFVVHWGSNVIAWPLGQSDDHASEWLSKHWVCKLRICRDDNEDDAAGYVDKTPP